MELLRINIFCLVSWICVLIFHVCLCSEDPANVAETETCEVGGVSGACCEVGGVSGACVPLPACALYTTLLQNTVTLLEGLQVTRERNCGYQDNNAKVCCPAMATTPSVPTTTASPENQTDDFVDALPAPGFCGQANRYLAGLFPFFRRGDSHPSAGHSSYAPSSYTSLPVYYPFGVADGSSGLSQNYSSDGPSTDPSSPENDPLGVAGGEPVLSRNQRSVVPYAVLNVPQVYNGQAVISRNQPPIPAYVPYMNPPPAISHGKPVISRNRRNISDAPLRQEEPIPINHGQPVMSRNRRPIPDAPPILPPRPIHHGLPVMTRSMARWMALLGYKNSAVFWKCGGSIITARHVLTAAHCIRPNLYLVRVGELDLAKDEPDASPFDILVKKMIPHENYTKFHNDIGVLVLQDAINFESARHVTPVCLPSSAILKDEINLNSAFITGWGETEKVGERPNRLLYAYVNILAIEECARAYHGSNLSVVIDERVLCAGDAANQRDACNGDSGGPLINEYFLNEQSESFYFQMGVISYGFRCSYHRSIGVYTNVQHFMPWIEEKVLRHR